MQNTILTFPVTEANPQPIDERIADAHRDATALITWLSIPGVALRYNLEAGYLIGMFKMCMSSPTPGESVNDIDLLVAYVKQAVTE